MASAILVGAIFVSRNNTHLLLQTFILLTKEFFYLIKEFFYLTKEFFFLTREFFCLTREFFFLNREFFYLTLEFFHLTQEQPQPDQLFLSNGRNWQQAGVAEFNHFSSRRTGKQRGSIHESKFPPIRYSSLSKVVYLYSKTTEPQVSSSKPQGKKSVFPLAT